MKVQTADKEGLFKQLTVEVEGDQVKRIADEVYEKVRQSVTIQGFRKGSAPLWLVKARYRDYIEEEVGKKVADETLKEALDQANYKPVADIFLEKVTFDDKNLKVTYSVTFEVAPSFDLKEIEGMEIEIPKVELNEEMIQERLKALREEHAVWEPVEREIKEGDLVTVEYEIKEIESGETLTGETSGIIGQNMFRKEVEEELKGKRQEEEIYLENIPLYDETGQEKGKANIKVKIKSVKEKKLPELNDDFAKETGLGETWEEALNKIKEELKEKIEETKRGLIEDAVSKKLVELHEFEIPQTLLRRELSFLIKKKVDEFSAYGIDPKYLDYKNLAESLKPSAEYNIKLRYILDRYAELKGIEVTDEDVEREYEEIAKQSGKSVQEVKDYFEREGMVNIVMEDARRKKALDMIVSKVNIKEVEKKEDSQEEKTEEEEVKAGDEGNS